jgi:serine/threonine-protein kinase
MAIQIGQQLGSLEVTALLGKGGMGEVYRARDTKLKRDVAIKILPDEFARDADRINRFQREAEVLASLSHPNIAGIYDLQHTDGTRFLVMELVEGETLADRINRGPLPVEEALQIGKSICEALEAAHEKSIIHRDLKPANVKITPDGAVKVLDFGLAKIGQTQSATALSNSPTLLSASMPGMIVGTAAYMSPEQARGREADQRSDVFAFGCVLYEMLTGNQAFQGEEVSDVLASVMKVEPDFNLLPANLNPRLNELLRRCLAKNRKERWYAIGDMRVEIEGIMAGLHEDKVQPAHRPWYRPLWKRVILVGVAVLLTFAVTAVTVWNVRPSPQSTGITRFPFLLPEGQAATSRGSHQVAISPDGTNIVYAANQQLYLRAMTEMDDRPIQGTALNAEMPFFSPDSSWLGFYARTEGKLKKIAVTGGAAVNICDADIVFGASWDSVGNIYFGQGNRGIFRVSANGGKAETAVAVKAGEFAHGPQVLPSGDALLFTLAPGTNEGSWNRAQIVVQQLKTGERKVLIEGGSDARYVPTGHIVYALGTTLLAVPFDVRKLQVTGGPIPIIETVRRATEGSTGAAQFSFSKNGSMVYFPADVARTGETTIALVDRAGARKPLNIPPGHYSQLRISPNGKQLALHTENGNDRVVWIYDLAETAPLRRLTFGGSNHRATWTPDSQRVVFTSNRDGDSRLLVQRADGNGPSEELTKGEPGTTLQSEAWSTDGKTLILSVSHTSNNNIRSLSMLTLGAEQKPKPLLPAYSTNSSLSPDGHWLAYYSLDSGVGGVYVQPFPPTGGKYQISTSGGRNPLWSPDGKQLFYEQIGDVTRVLSVDVQTKPTFMFEKTTPLPIEGIIDIGPRTYDISPDGKYFVVLLPKAQPDTSKAPREQINITLNWFDELKQRVPVH